MLLAFDDTDSRSGGCTTHLAFHVLLALPHLALRGLPRLVRLNPNVPHKTRGNGAVVLPLGHPDGPQVRVGELRGREILAFPEGRPAEPDAATLDKVWQVIQQEAQPGSQPAVAWAAQAPHEGAYWQAVRSEVKPATARTFAEEEGMLERHAGEGRALAGCMGALAWPGPPSSYEFLAYREPARWGTPRAVDEAPLRGLDLLGSTFHTFDPAAQRVVCVPHGPDPVLLGLRGRDPQRLHDMAVRATSSAAREPVDGWLLWATNQASGDHVTPVDGVDEGPTWSTLAVSATVIDEPRTITGGHVVLRLEDAQGLPFDAVAFEPTHGFRDDVRQLLPGDVVTAVGAFGETGLNLEKLHVLSLAEATTRIKPSCAACGGTMQSKGPSTGYQCRDCGAKAPWDSASLSAVERTLAKGWYEVPVGARRHLHRPVAWLD